MSAYSGTSERDFGVTWRYVTWPRQSGIGVEKVAEPLDAVGDALRVVEPVDAEDQAPAVEAVAHSRSAKSERIALRAVRA